MCECIKCSITSFLVGVVVGGIIVITNKKVEKTLQKGKNMAEQKIEEIKESAADKMEETADKIDNVAKKLKK